MSVNERLDCFIRELRNDLKTLGEENAALKKAEKGYSMVFQEVEQILGKALGYPEYDASFFPDGQPDGSVCIGDSTPGSLAEESAAKIMELMEQIADLETTIEDYRSNYQ